MLIIRGVNLFPSQIEELILADAPPGAALRARGPPRAAPRRAEVIVEARPAAADEAARTAAAPATSRHHVKSRIGVTSEVMVLAPGEVERSLGKAKRILDLRPRD